MQRTRQEIELSKKSLLLFNYHIGLCDVCFSKSLLKVSFNFAIKYSLHLSSSANCSSIFKVLIFTFLFNDGKYTSSFALKAGDSYVACDQDATKQACTFPEGSTKLTDAVAGALYALTGVENAYIIHGSGDGIIVTWTVDASAVEGGLKLSLVSPECQAQRDVRVISLTVETIG